MKVDSSPVQLPVGILRDVIDQTPEPMLILDPDLRLHHINAAAAPFFQDVQEALEPRALQLGDEPRTRLDEFSSLRGLVTQGRSVGPVRIDRTQKVNGRIVRHIFDATAHPFRMSGKRGLLVTLQDVRLA